jgi:hypothetical protein
LGTNGLQRDVRVVAVFREDAREPHAGLGPSSVKSSQLIDAHSFARNAVVSANQ